MYWRITSTGTPAIGTFISIDKFTKFCSRLRTEHYMHMINVLEFISLYILNQSDLFLMIFAEWFWLIEWQCFNLSHIIFARTSFNGSCCDSPLPDFNNTLLWFWITHFFLSHPSDVLSGDIKSPLNCPQTKHFLHLLKMDFQKNWYLSIVSLSDLAGSSIDRLMIIHSFSFIIPQTITLKKRQHISSSAVSFLMVSILTRTLYSL